MLVTKRLFWATTALTSSLLFASAAMAQSTATQAIDDPDEDAAEVEQVVVTGSRVRTIEGVVRNETAPKARTSIDQEYLTTQQAGQTIFQSLNQTPGLNFTNNDPYGSSGGNIRLRGQDGNRVALLWDGIPLNDTGNYATFTNQLLDPELVDRVNVNTGTADVDSPSPAAVGGTVNYTTIRPTEEFSGWVQPSVGSWNFRRIMARLDSGALGPFDTRGFVAGSYQDYDKFRGPGELEKQQFNAYAFQELRGDDFIGVGFHYNQNRNSQYRQLSFQNFLLTGGGLDNDKQCIRLTPVAGTVQNENARGTGNLTGGNTVVTSQDQRIEGQSCTNYFELRNNPSNTGNVRGQSRFQLTDALLLTFDPYFQYVLANGGGFTVLAESDGRLRGASTAGGADINGDGDILDQSTIYTPSNTNTRRFGFTTSLLYELAQNHQFRVAYTVDYGRHRQTGEAGYVTASGAPEDVFGGKDGTGERVRAADGSFYRTRDRFSIASLQQFAAQYRGRLFDDRLVVDVGVRAPFFTRDLNQYCFTQDAITSTTDPARDALIGGFAVRCTSETPIPQSTGAVRFASTARTDFIPQYATTFEYDAVLPNVGASYEFIDNHRVFAAFAKGFAAPRTDNLYSAALINGQVVFPDVQPEESENYDLGYRFSGSGLLVYATIFHNEFTNRIVSSFDPDLGFSVDRNVGAVNFDGVDFQIGWDPIEQVSLSAFASYLDAELQDDTPSNLGTVADTPTAGKKLVEVPEMTFGGRASFRPTEYLRFGVQFKYVDSRFTNDLNTEQFPDYTLWDLDARLELEPFGPLFETSFLQLNVSNLFDEKYLGSISSQFGSGLATGQVGPPLTVQLSLRAGF